MTFDDIIDGPAPPLKVSWTEPNVANRIRDHLLKVIPEAFDIDGVWVTGSNVWRFIYGNVPSPDADIDVFVEDVVTTVVVPTPMGPGEVTDTARTLFLRRLEIEAQAPTAPSAGARADLEGTKSKLKDGRTVDVWRTEYGSNPIVDTLMGYPEHSHAHCRAAYNCKTGVLIVLPNPKAP